MKTYHRFLSKHWSYNFLLSFCIINILLLVGNLVKYGSKVGLLNILPIIPTLLPGMLVYSLPMSALISTVTTLSRARRQTEPITLASSGISLFQLTPPFLLIGISLSILTAVSFEWLQPFSEKVKREYLASIGARLIDNELSKPQAHLQFPDVSIFFFKKEDQSRSAVIQQREKGKITAELMVQNVSYEINKSKKELELTFADFNLIKFENAVPRGIGDFSGANKTLSFSYPESFSGKSSYRQMPPTEMWRQMKEGKSKNPLKLKSYFYEKISLIFSPLLLIAAAFPLGFMGNSESRIVGFFLGLGLAFLVYYPLLIAGKKMTMAELDPAWLIMQIPNFALLLIGIIGLSRLDHRI
ncbi:MAG: LptF/LptG family permease [Planctomycetes bacterium]|nr:LptF/LptG family permease [Planctomycetota bacterium]